MKKHATPAAVDLDADDAPIITLELIAQGKVTVYPRPARYGQRVKNGIVTLTAKHARTRTGP